MLDKHPSIQNRLMVYLGVVIIGLFGVSSFGVYFFMRQALYAQVDKQLLRITEDFIAETERMPDGEVESEFHELDIESFRKSDNGRAAYYELRDYKGEPLVRSASFSQGGKLPFYPVDIGMNETRPILLNGQLQGRVIFTSFALKLEEQDLDDPGDLAEIAHLSPAEKAYIASYNENDQENRVYLAIAEDTTELRRVILMLGLAQNITGIILAGATLILVRKIVKRVLLPVVKISQMTEDIGPDNMEVILPVENVPSEILPLIVKFNKFIERLSAAISRERRFSANLAHELRTPVAELRTLLEVANDAKRVEEDALEVFEVGAEISQRMSKVIEVLTAIHQERSGVLQIEVGPVSIASSMKGSMKAFDSQTQRRFCFNGGGKEHGTIQSDSYLLRAVIDNLMNNAATHSPADSKITIGCQKNSFSIENQTSDLEGNDMELMNEPFWQKDSAHSNANNFGLGLTIVAAYLRMLNGDIEQCLDGEKLIIKVTVPDQVYLA